jgi:hypothetical protein
MTPDDLAKYPGPEPVLDYVRLNITAVRSPA